MAKSSKVASASVAAASPTVTVYATADAAGADTLATGAISLNIKETGHGTKIKGEAISTATSFSSDGTVFAGAQSGAEFSGVDSSSVKIKTKVSSGVTDGEAWTTETTTAKFRATEVEGREPKEGSASVKTKTQTINDGEPDRVEGNIAEGDVASNISADNSANSVSINVIAVEDVYSGVSLVVTAEVSDLSFSYELDSGYGNSLL